MSTEIAVREQQQAVTIWSVDDPDAALESASRVATAAMRMIQTQGLIQNFGQSRHVKVDGWLCIARLAGARTHVEWERPLRDDDGNVLRDDQGRPHGWEACVQVLNEAGDVVGDAVSQCARDEGNWRTRDDYAVRSMAQTRATGKALRVALGFVAAMAGFNATPAEEMPSPQPSRGVPPPRMEDTFGPGSGEGAAAHAPADPVAPAAPAPGVISEAQLKRLHTLASKHDVPRDEAKRIVGEVAGVDSSKDIPRDRYDAVIAVLQAYESVSQFQAPPGAAA